MFSAFLDTLVKFTPFCYIWVWHVEWIKGMDHKKKLYYSPARKTFETKYNNYELPVNVVPNLCVSRKVFLNIKSIGILSVVQYGNCLGVAFGLLTILLRFWTNICPSRLDVMYQPMTSVCVTRISLGLMINAGILLASSWRLIFGGPVIALKLTWKSLSGVKWELMKPTRWPSHLATV